MIHRCIKNIAGSLALASLVACSNTGSVSGDNSSNGNNGDVNTLQLISPLVIYSKSGSVSDSYVVINNPTNKAVKNVHYTLGSPIGGGSGVSIDPVSAANCATMAAYSQCNVKVQIASGTIAGSFGFSASNNSGILSKLNKTVNAASLASVVGVEQAAYNTASGADGITLSYYQTVINGTPYILVNALVASANAGTFNNVVLVNNSGVAIPNQQIIGAVSSAQGSTFSILLPVPSGTNASQTIKVQTQQNGSVVSTSTTSNSLNTSSGIGIANMLPSAVYLTANHPEQIITFSNTGDTSAQLQQLVSNNPNVEVVFSPSSLINGGITTATLRLKNTSVAGTSGNVTLSYNNGQAQVSTSAAVDQNIEPMPNPSPTPTPSPGPIPNPFTAGLTATFSPDNNFFTTTVVGTVSRQMTLTNTGNTSESGIVLTLPTNFTISNGNSNSCTITQGTSPAAISDTLAASTGSCNVTVTYTNSAVTAQSSGNMSIAYNYNNGVAATPTTAAVNYKVNQSTANLVISSPTTPFIFGTTLVDGAGTSASQVFTVQNTGEVAASSIAPVVNSTTAGIFTATNSGVTNACGASLAINVSCQIGVQFGPVPDNTASGPQTGNLTINYLPYTGASSTNSLVSAISGQVANSGGAIFDAPTSGVPGAGYTGTWPSLSITQDVSGADAAITYTITNTGGDAATNFVVTLPAAPTNWTSLATTCPTATGTNLAVNDSCTVTATPNTSTGTTISATSITLGLAWSDQNSPAGESQNMSIGLPEVTVVPLPPVITITNLTGNNSESMMGTTPIRFTATISGSGTSTLSASLANSITGTIISNPSPCALDTAGTTSCTFSILPWYTEFENSIAGVDGYDPFVPAGTTINLSATNDVTISGAEKQNTISYSITTPYVYLAAPMVGTASESNTGITWGTGGTVSTRFVVGTDPTGATCTSGQEIESDMLTGLTWVKAPSSSAYTWTKAKAKQPTAGAAIPATYCGYTDWRLPTLNELFTLVNYAATQNSSTPAAWLNSQGFTGVKILNFYWSSTVYSGSDAWGVYFSDGSGSHPDDVSYTTYVWPVRGGEYLQQQSSNEDTN